MRETTKKKEKVSNRADFIDKKAILDLQDYRVVKSNKLIQNARFSLSLQEQKIILYLISKIKPEDLELKEQIFEIIDFCRVCGLETNSGANYKYIKQTLKGLRDKSIWINLGEYEETTLAWIDKITINHRSGTVRIKLDDMMKPYLLQLREKFTRFELLYTIAMNSQYSIRLYELLKSYEYRRGHTFELDELKRLINAENYSRFPDFRRYVIERGLKEINDLTDLNVTYAPEMKGRKCIGIKFSVSQKKDIGERLKMWQQIEMIVDGLK
jgi:plasmid replication initiation protein